MNDKAVKLFEGSNLVFIATIMKDGSPQLSPVWANYEDEHILVNTAEGRLKHKNVLRDPRVAVSAVDQNNPLNMTTIQGKVIEIIPDYEYLHANKLTKKYMGKDNYPFRQPGEKRIIFKILPEKVYVLPELTMNQKGRKKGLGSLTTSSSCCSSDCSSCGSSDCSSCGSSDCSSCGSSCRSSSRSCSCCCFQCRISFSSACSFFCCSTSFSS